MSTTCRHCHKHLHRDEDVLVDDETGGDVCGSWGTFGNEPHVAMTTCYACDAELLPDNGAPDDPVTYQFDNALWIGFHGGYGMFVDNLEARWPTNTDERWLRNSDERDEWGVYCDFTVEVDDAGVPHLIDNPDYEPAYREDRILPGRPDYEAVICHDCAHKLCEQVPWMDKLIHPRCSHTHRTAWLDAHPEHPEHYKGCEVHDRG